MEKKATRIGLNLLALLLVFCMGFGFLSANTVMAEGLKDTGEIQNTFNQEDDQIKISTPEDLKALREYVKSGRIKQGQSVLLMKDIDLNGFDLGEYNSATAWTLSFDGNGYTITGFNGSKYGLFGSHFAGGKDKDGNAVNTVIKNLHLNVDVNIKALLQIIKIQLVSIVLKIVLFRVPLICRFQRMAAIKLSIAAEFWAQQEIYLPIQLL